MNDLLNAKLKTLPRSPGVYFHKSMTGEVIYIGKAAVLRNRVRQYFQSGKDFDIKTKALVAEIADTDWIETESEIDALFLESEMVKRYMPRYNILLRDDKSQMYVRIDSKSEWPTVSFTRNPADDGAEYFGPFYNAYAVKKALRYLRKVFPYYIKARPDKPDLDAHIGLSPGPDVSNEEYKRTLRQLTQYIMGKRVAIGRELEQEMKRAAATEDFETAAKLRNRIGYLNELQRRIMFGDREHLDISKDKALSGLVELFGMSAPPKRIEGYDISHMSGHDVVSSMVVFTNGVSDRAEYRKFKMTRQTNDDVGNMRETLERRFAQRNRKVWGVPDLVVIDGGRGQLAAALDVLGQYDIKVACLGVAKRNEELVIDVERSGFGADALQKLQTDPPDGVYAAMQGGYLTVNLHVGRMNASSHSKNLRGGETVSRYDDIVKLFQRVRDESHRFAITYHTSLKRQRQTTSVLDDIPGIGPVARKKLLKTFGSVRAIQMAEYTEIERVLGPKRAQLVKQQLT